MFDEPLFFASRHVRAGNAQLFSEFVATFGLLSVIWGCARLRSSAFANPAVTLARAASDTFAGSLAGQTMPPGGPFWTAEQFGLYDKWRTEGYQP
jgi:glycerol uptake facilitator-like aquaporin